MSRTIHQSNIEALATRTMQGIGSFLLTQTSATPTAIAAIIKKYTTLMGNSEATRRELCEARANIDTFRGQYEEDVAWSREREAKLTGELEALRNQMVERDEQIVMLSMEYEVVRTSKMQAYTRGRED
ncbi:hypothetical protein Salat_2110800 [Sesamum alatum]|uniref:Uncharacterized protein n=1 Tax=Sesamum alatum TaxID=300844 RepID=A0AAE1Y1M7_9LAMI|nr:hypothetical protein Salat_2110800 [Sesamum alatum]